MATPGSARPPTPTAATIASYPRPEDHAFRTREADGSRPPRATTTLNGWLGLTAIIEAATGLALLIDPSAVTQWLLGAPVSGVAVALGRVTGLGLLSLGLACWLGRNGAGDSTPAFWAMLTYNLLVTLYLGHLGVSGEWVGRFLWPAAALHAVVTVFLARAWFETAQSGIDGSARSSRPDETL